MLASLFPNLGSESALLAAKFRVQRPIDTMLELLSEIISRSRVRTLIAIRYGHTEHGAIIGTTLHSTRVLYCPRTVSVARACTVPLTDFYTR
eukprot:SAG31_NODE_2368_length_5854_cov_19.043440_3_plen_92_part_00